MNTVLLELRTEELPPAFCQLAPDTLKRDLQKRLSELFSDLVEDAITVWVTPRRLAVKITGLPGHQTDQTITHKGPPVRIGLDADGNPTAAAQAFAAKCNTTVDKLTQQTIGKETYLLAEETKLGRPTPEVLAEIFPEALDALQGPRFMRWGDYALKFPRPILGMVALWNDTVLPLTYHHLTATNQTPQVTLGHRWHTASSIQIQQASQYEKQMETEGKVQVDPAKRRAMIEAQLAEAAQQAGGTLVPNEDLLDEVIHIVEWPFVVTGHIQAQYLSLPRCVIETVMASHQRYFSVEGSVDHKDGKLLPVFLAVSNGLPKAAENIRLGNEKVLKARLNDAVFFYDADTKKTLAQRVPELAGMTFQKGMGTMQDKALRLEALVKVIGPAYGLTAEQQAWANEAALLAKADLATQLVFEFTELEGHIGAEYARKEGLPAIVADAIEQHYQPRFQGDALPAAPVAQVVALADKLDTLVAAMAPKNATLPTGSRDPFGLRRMANGIVLILLIHGKAFDLKTAMEGVFNHLPSHEGVAFDGLWNDRLAPFVLQRLESLLADLGLSGEVSKALLNGLQWNSLHTLSERGQLLANMSADDRLALYEPVNRLVKMKLKSAVNEINEALLTPIEVDVHVNLQAFVADKASDFDKKLAMLQSWRQPIYQLFETLLVNDPDEAIKNNRHRLLLEVLACYQQFADFTAFEAVVAQVSAPEKSLAATKAG
ncbi:MAG: glycine--tRNA ligase subunit beta [Vampirovibrionales bacterium]|nr:glycine--tRNA ligase subunit beta [Vampirovibrionales bacterium]